MPTRRDLLLGLCAASVAPRRLWGAGRFQVPVKTLKVLPRTENEVADVHQRHRSQACEFLAAGESLERTRFIPELPKNPLDAAETRLPIPTARLGALSVGLQVSREDRAEMPRLSAGQVLSYIDGHYVCVLARVQRDLDTGLAYLHHRPLAATAQFRGARLSEGFTELVAASVREMRSLGLFLRPEERVQAESLRTLVMLFKSTRSVFNELSRKAELRPTYEYVFMRATGAGTDRSPLDLHTFITTEDRTLLHVLHPFELPGRSEMCDVRGTVYFTDYKVANLLPAASATRQTSVRSLESFAVADLDKYAAEQGWKGDALDNLGETLDAIIEHRVPPSLRSPLSAR